MGFACFTEMKSVAWETHQNKVYSNIQINTESVYYGNTFFVYMLKGNLLYWLNWARSPDCWASFIIG